MSHEIETGMGKKTLTGYLLGFILSLIFTVFAFWVVTIQSLNKADMYITVSVLAIAQLIVQVIFFLRLNGSKEGKWNLFSFIFTIFVTFVLVGGSLWIMHNLNYNMMH